MEISQSSSSRPTSRRPRDLVVASRTSTRSRVRRSNSSSSDEDDAYAALFPYTSRPRDPLLRTRTLVIDFVDYRQAYNSRRPRTNFREEILAICRQGAIHMLDRAFHEASLVPARPDELPTTDEMVLDALDAPSTGMLSAVVRRDPSYKWSDLAILKAIEKDKAYDPPLYLDAFLYLGLDPHKSWDTESENHDALMWAIRSGSAEFVSMLLCAGANPNGAKFRKLFAHIAVATGIWQIARRPQFAIIYSLIKHGASPNGTGALQWAVGRLAYEKIKDGRVPWEANRIAQMLIEQGHAHINDIPDTYPEYPRLRHALGEATYFENVDFIEYLLDHGADPSILAPHDPRTAWEIAVSEDGVPSVIDTLVGRGISPATLWGILRP